MLLFDLVNDHCCPLVPLVLPCLHYRVRVGRGKCYQTKFVGQHAVSQTLRCRGLQQRKCSFTRQPREEAGEQVPNRPPGRRGAWDIY